MKSVHPAGYRCRTKKTAIKGENRQSAHRNFLAPNPASDCLYMQPLSVHRGFTWQKACMTKTMSLLIVQAVCLLTWVSITYDIGKRINNSWWSHVSDSVSSMFYSCFCSTSCLQRSAPGALMISQSYNCIVAKVGKEVLINKAALNLF